MRPEAAGREKFFCCQKSRLRVRETPGWERLAISGEVDRAVIVDIADDKNHFNTSVCCDSANLIATSRVNFPDRSVNVLSLRRPSRIARSRF